MSSGAAGSVIVGVGFGYGGTGGSGLVDTSVFIER